MLDKSQSLKRIIENNGCYGLRCLGCYFPDNEECLHSKFREQILTDNQEQIIVQYAKEELVREQIELLLTILA